MDNIEVGDSFIINWKNYPERSRCKFPNKKFIVKKVHFDEIHFDDFRTNKKCDCSICNYSWIMNYPDITTKRKVNISRVIVTEKRLEREREIKLKLILGK